MGEPHFVHLLKSANDLMCNFQQCGHLQIRVTLWVDKVFEGLVHQWYNIEPEHMRWIFISTAFLADAIMYQLWHMQFVAFRAFLMDLQSLL